MNIGLIGRMGSGKTTIANKIIKDHDFVRLSFADKLKEDIIKFNLTEDGTIKKSRDRALLQNYGQLRRGELSFLKYHNGELVNLKNSTGIFFYRKSVSGKMTNYENLGISHSDYWVEFLLGKINKLEKAKSIIVDDIRRINEAKMLMDNKFLIIKIECEEQTRISRLINRDGDFDPNTLENISESEVDSLPYNLIINNDFDLDKTMNELSKCIFENHINI
jgi:dephospho-CoA kinase